MCALIAASLDNPTTNYTPVYILIAGWSVMLVAAAVHTLWW